MWFLQIVNSHMPNDQFQSLFIEISQSLIQGSTLNKQYSNFFREAHDHALKGRKDLESKESNEDQLSEPTWFDDPFQRDKKYGISVFLGHCPRPPL